MADKEAHVYVIDVGMSMSQKQHDRDLTDLDWGMQYVWDKIATTVRNQHELIAFVDSLRSALAERPSMLAL